MIISKSALQLASLAGGNKYVPVFNCLCIEGGGTVVATNGRALALVSPVSDKIRDAVPLEQKDATGERILLTLDAVQTILKAIPRDTQFKGLLEHCAVYLPEPGADTVKVVVTDGRRKNEMTIRRMTSNYVSYEKVLREAAESRIAEGKENVKCVLNRKRMGALVEAIDKVCPYDGEFSPVYWEFTRGGNVIIRAVNELTNQRLFSVFATVEWQDGKWLEWDEWEGGICALGWTIIEEKCSVCGNRKRKDWASDLVECSFVGCPSKQKRIAVKLSPEVKSLAQVNTILKRRAVKLVK